MNSSGEFNSPFGHYKNPNIVNEPVLLSLIHIYGDARLRHAHKFQRRDGSLRLQHGQGIGQTHVLAGVHHDAPHDEFGVHARVEQAAEPEERRIRVCLLYTSRCV